MAVLHVFLLALTLTLTRCQLDQRTIFQYLKDQNLATLTGFLKAAGLEAAFDDPNAAPVTLFAPAEAAWAKLPGATLLSLATNSTALGEVLQEHVVDQLVFGPYIRDKQTKMNLNKNNLEFRIYPNGIRMVNNAVRVGQDINLINGIVHIVDAVILPTDNNIGEYVAQHPSDFKDLFGLLVLGRLFGALETGGPFTVFAPTDAAFDAVSAALPGLIANRTALTAVLSNHVVSNTYWSAGLANGDSLTTLSGNTLTVDTTSGVKINGANVVQANIATSNGVIHSIDKVLLP